MAPSDEIRTSGGAPAPEAPAPGQPDPGHAVPAAGQQASGDAAAAPAATKNTFVPLLLGFGLLYLVVAYAVNTWKADGGGVLGFLWAFLWSYGAVLLLFIAATFAFYLFWGSLHAAVKAWGPYAVALVVGPLTLWYLAGQYNWFRDVAIGLVALLAVAVLHRHAFRAVAWLLEKIERSRKQAAEKQGTSDSILAAAAGRLRASFGVPSWCRCYAVVAWALLTWAITSAANAWVGPHWVTMAKPMDASPERFAQLARGRVGPSMQQDAAADAAPPRLGLALSGGGFRAALMHAGVLAALEDLKAPIAGLATVSGGSIIGGFYVAGGDPAAFRDAVAEGRFNLRRDLFDVQNLPRLPCPGHLPIIDIDLLWFCSHSRIDAQSNLLDRVLFNGKRVDGLRSDRLLGDGGWWTKPPWWVIGATDLVHGEAIGISADGLFRRAHATPFRGRHRDQLRRDPSATMFHDLSLQTAFGNKRVAELVAISGAFPGAFGATDFEYVSGRRFKIVDGGLTDNLGYSFLASALEESAWRRGGIAAIPHVEGTEWQPEAQPGASATDGPAGREWTLDMIIVSDGGMPLFEKRAMFAHEEVLRAMDVVYASSGIAVAGNNVEKIWLSPGNIQVARLRDEDLQRIPEAFRRAWNLRTLGDLQEDVMIVRRTFLDTSTLKDSFGAPLHERVKRYFGGDPPVDPRETVDRLFRLGQYLVYLNLDELRAGLKTRSGSEGMQAAAALSPR